MLTILRNWLIENGDLLRSLAPLFTIIAGAGAVILSYRQIIAVVLSYFEQRRQQNLKLVAFEAIRFTKADKNRYVFDVRPIVKLTLAQIFHNTNLETVVEKAARGEGGFLVLPLSDHNIVMDTLKEEAIIALDAKGTKVTWIRGGACESQMLLMCPFTRKGRRASHLIRVMVLDMDFADIVLNQDVEIQAADGDYAYRIPWWPEIAERWKKGYGSEETATIRAIDVLTA